MPKLDAPLAIVSKHSDLAFEDMGHLGDPMDKRSDIILKRSWDTCMAKLRLALAMTCIARNFEFLLKQLHMTASNPREQLLKSFPMLFKAVGFITDASAESMKLLARAASLSVAVRRALWLKTWPGRIQLPNYAYVVLLFQVIFFSPLNWTKP